MRPQSDAKRALAAAECGHTIGNAPQRDTLVSTRGSTSSALVCMQGPMRSPGRGLFSVSQHHVCSSGKLHELCRHGELGRLSLKVLVGDVADLR